MSAMPLCPLCAKSPRSAMMGLCTKSLRSAMPLLGRGRKNATHRLACHIVPTSVSFRLYRLQEKEKKRKEKREKKKEQRKKKKRKEKKRKERKRKEKKRKEKKKK